MALFGKDSFQAVKKMTEPVYKTPKSVQQLIPISRIAENGVFELEKREEGNRLFDKAYIFHDINYVTKDEQQRQETMVQFCEMLNTLDIDYKFIIALHHRDIERVKEEIEPAINGNPLQDFLISSYKELLEQRLKDGRGEVEQVMYFVISCPKPDFANANSFFHVLESRLMVAFRALGSGLIPLNAIGRLRALHNFYRLGHEEQFSITWEGLRKTKRDWKNDICPGSIKESKSFLELEDQKACILFARDYPNWMGDGILAELTSVNFHAIFSMDLVPIPQELALRKLQAALTNNEMAISKEQDMKNKYRAFSSDITYAKRRKKEELEYYLDQFHTNDQKMFYLGFTIVVYGKDDKELKDHVQTIRSMGKGIQFEVLEWRQLKGFHTSLPIGTRQVDIMRTVFTTSMAAFIPFNVQELFDTNGLYYGVNKVSKNLILADRKSLKNGNGFTFGLTGSGKSMDNKSELCQVYYQTKDRMIICDPQGEYKEICANLEGEYIDFSLEGDKYMNPLEIPEYIDAHFNQEQFILDKYEFLQSLCRSVLDPLPYTANHNSVVERCTRKLYQNIFAKKNPESPTIEDLREYLGAQIEPEAKSLYLALEAFTEGSLNIFGRKGNVNLQNRLLVFGLGQVRDSLKKQALLVLNETIRSQIEYNNQQNICTWVWMDEFQIITKETYGAMAFNNLYRTVRKKGGILTGITQTLSDNIFNEDMQAMLNNCEYISVLSQAGIDRDLLRKVLPEITEEELGFITNAEKGCGIRRFGEKIIPFDNTIPPDNPLYELFNTNFFERQRKGHENETSNTRKTEA